MASQNRSPYAASTPLSTRLSALSAETPRAEPVRRDAPQQSKTTSAPATPKAQQFPVSYSAASHSRTVTPSSSREAAPPYQFRSLTPAASRELGVLKEEPHIDMLKLWPLQLILRIAQFAFSIVAFSLVCAMQSASGNAALHVRPFVFLLSMSLIGWVYSLGATVFIIVAARWPVTVESLTRVNLVQRIFLHIDFVILVLLFASACSTASVFPLYCYNGSAVRQTLFHFSTIAVDVCNDILEANIFGLLAAFAYMSQFWMLVTPFVWDKN